MNNGLSKKQAIVITDKRDIQKSITNELDKIYGIHDGSYFIMSQQQMDDKKTNKKYQVVTVENVEDKCHQYWFDIT